MEKLILMGLVLMSGVMLEIAESMAKNEASGWIFFIIVAIVVGFFSPIAAFIYIYDNNMFNVYGQ